MNASRGYVGLTDPDWYTYLSSLPRVDEVNFWQPHGNREFRALKPGDPFFFKLRAPQKAIAGFGYFQRFESMPAWMAWDCFGDMNGAPTFEALVERLERLRGESDPLGRVGDFRIGCIMISAPIFFPESSWVRPPDDWARTGIQQGKGYDVTAGEGRRLLEECLARALQGSRYWNVEPPVQVVSDDSPRYGAEVTVRPRLGQGLFSLAVRDAYDGACAVTHEHSHPVLEAAHIKPYALGGLHRVDNGLLLRRDLHRLFDRGYVTVSPDYVFQVGERLRADFKNGRSYYGMSGSRIALPGPEALQPDKQLLEWHMKEVFKG